ncbi:hypothetical protein PR048_023965 [Dryococelus australis]|uniref:Uncharacterized protein n=1 Tax=Dryococelus australis TaxID=614101 RepID=A0ABQ9GVK0_9NEOP|nr:hypothetical protein PR048_023965 [Dryococelus australis]
MNFISISSPALNSNGAKIFCVDLRSDHGSSFGPRWCMVQPGISGPARGVTARALAYTPRRTGFDSWWGRSHDATERRVFSGISRIPRPCTPAPQHTHLASSSSTLKTSMLRGTQTSSLHFPFEEIWTALNIEVFRGVEGAAPGMKGLGKWEISEKTRRPARFPHGKIRRAEVVRWSDYSSLNWANRRGGPDFRMLGSCRTMPLTGGVFSGFCRFRHPCVPALPPRSPRFIVLSSQDLAWQGPCDKIRTLSHGAGCLDIRTNISVDPLCLEEQVPPNVGIAEWQHPIRNSPPSLIPLGAAVAERLDSSPHHHGERVRSPAGSLRNFAQVGIVLDDAAGRWAFSGISRFFPPLHSGSAPYSPFHRHRLSRPLLFFPRNSIALIYVLCPLKAPAYMAHEVRCKVFEVLFFPRNSIALIYVLCPLKAPAYMAHESHRYTLCNENTHVSSEPLRLAAMAHLMSVEESTLELMRFLVFKKKNEGKFGLGCVGAHIRWFNVKRLRQLMPL